MVILMFDNVEGVAGEYVVCIFGQVFVDVDIQVCYQLQVGEWVDLCQLIVVIDIGVGGLVFSVVGLNGFVVECLYLIEVCLVWLLYFSICWGCLSLGDSWMISFDVFSNFMLGIGVVSVSFLLILFDGVVFLCLFSCYFYGCLEQIISCVMLFFYVDGMV